MFDLNRTIKLVGGALFNREAAWKSYLPEAGDWKRTAFLLTGPLIIVSGLIAYMLSLMTADTTMFAQFRPTPVAVLLGLVTSAIAAGVVALIFSSLAGAFGGKSSFAIGLAATTLAFVPAYIGQALAWLPWIGNLLALGLMIYALIQLWKIIPMYLEVPDSKRAAHYILSLIATILVMVVIGQIINPMLYGHSSRTPLDTMHGTDMSSAIGTKEKTSGGVLSGIQQKAALVAEAEKDRYTPPDDGKLTERQMRDYVAVMQAVAKARAQTTKRMQALADKADAGGKMSAKDFGSMMSSVTDVAGISTVEIEAVRAIGGNWAEHKWVRESVTQALMNKNGSATIKHNYALYKQYADQMSPTALQ